MAATLIFTKIAHLLFQRIADTILGVENKYNGFGKKGVAVIMNKEKIKVYTYKRVSTAMQIDGYSLDAQRARMKAYADFNDYEIVGEYEDAGKSGKSIEGRMQFRQMMEDVKSGKDNISYVLVF